MTGLQHAMIVILADASKLLVCIPSTYPRVSLVLQTAEHHFRFYVSLYVYFPAICNMLKLIEILLRMSNYLAMLKVSMTGHVHITISRAIQFDF